MDQWEVGKNLVVLPRRYSYFQPPFSVILLLCDQAWLNLSRELVHNLPFTLRHDNTSNKITQLVSQHCGATDRKSMLHVFPPAYKHISQQYKIVAVEWIQTSHWLIIPHPTSVTLLLYWITPGFARDVILLRDKLICGSNKRSQKKKVSTSFVAKSRTIFYFLQQTYFNLKLIILMRDKFVCGWKNAQHRFSICFAAILRDKMRVFASPLSCL